MDEALRDRARFYNNESADVVWKNLTAASTEAISEFSSSHNYLKDLNTTVMALERLT